MRPHWWQYTTVRELAAPEVAALLREGFGLDLPELVSLLN